MPQCATVFVVTETHYKNSCPDKVASACKLVRILIMMAPRKQCILQQPNPVLIMPVHDEW